MSVCPSQTYLESRPFNLHRHSLKYFFLIFREQKNWNVKKSLLLDGGNENKEINLFKEIFWPDNIVKLFKKYKVKKKFDLLSVDTDSYDFFMLETILEAGYKPRVIIAEYNANFETSEAR